MKQCLMFKHWAGREASVRLRCSSIRYHVNVNGVKTGPKQNPLSSVSFAHSNQSKDRYGNNYQRRCFTESQSPSAPNTPQDAHKQAQQGSERTSPQNPSQGKTSTTARQNPDSEKRVRQPLSKEKEDQVKRAFEYCIEEVKKQEPQTFLALQHLKCNETQKLGVIVTRAFNLELSRVRSEAKGTDAAKMRLHWWLSAVSDLANEEKERREAMLQNTAYQKHIPDTPVLVALRVVRHRYHLNGQWLLRLVSGRDLFLQSNTFATISDMEEYAENTQAVLLYLAMQILGCVPNRNSNSNSNGNASSGDGDDTLNKHFTAVSHIAAFMQFAILLKSIPFAAANGFIALPDDVANKYSVWKDEETILKGQCSDALRSAVEDLTEKAYAHLFAARDIKNELDSKVKSILLLSIAAQRFLNTLEKCKFDPFHQDLLQPDLGSGFRLALQWSSLLEQREKGERQKEYIHAPLSFFSLAILRLQYDLVVAHVFFFCFSVCCAVFSKCFFSFLRVGMRLECRQIKQMLAYFPFCMLFIITFFMLEVFRSSVYFVNFHNIIIIIITVMLFVLYHWTKLFVYVILKHPNHYMIPMDMNVAFNNIDLIAGSGYTNCSGSFDGTSTCDIETTKQLVLFKGRKNLIISIKWNK
ncbi:hypothetical protein RFI_00539 [Reticulomyxa filosa]|uniref:Uncharacterized protein n=1 Tax=Reticulomyxa filosa TaxID=46433 RepID=X6PEJ2_RETFI|nr:hypothetical protein RFI_00539 [Reticulomyxa filosa]|eukprot:ETO36523.1 hypothetical protein RFI_00539 [Reticulomyxa filosa]